MRLLLSEQMSKKKWQSDTYIFPAKKEVIFNLFQNNKCYYVSPNNPAIISL